MLGLIQRVSEASVTVDGKLIGQIDRGLLLLLGIQKHDSRQEIEKLLKKVLAYRVFPDDKGNMNLSLTEVDGSLLIVSQFTLAADTHKGLRPSFSSSAAPDAAELLYNEFVDLAKSQHPSVETGKFGADMKVLLINDGPVTFLLDA